MSHAIEKEKLPRKEVESQATRLRGIGNPGIHSQDADRHRKTEHKKSDK